MKKEVIVEHSFGSFHVYGGTVENAKKILSFNEDVIDKMAIKIANEKLPYLIKENIVKVINKILVEEIGSMASKTIEVTEENKKEVVIYCFNNGISVNPRTGISSDYDFFKKFKLEDFSFFKEHESYPKESILIDDYVAEQAHKYKVIKNDLWKQGLADSRKISYILEFANELAHRDVKYELVEFKETI